MDLEIILIVLFGLAIIFASLYVTIHEENSATTRDAVFKMFCMAVLAILVCFVLLKISGTTPQDVINLYTLIFGGGGTLWHSVT